MNQATQAQLISAKVLTFPDSIGNDSNATHVNSVQSGGIIYYEAYDPDNNAARVYGYSPKTDENKELYQIPSRSKNTTFFKLGSKVYHGHNGSSDFEFKIAEFDALSRTNLYKPSSDLHFFHGFRAGTNKHAYFYGKNQTVTGIFSFNSNSGKYDLVMREVSNNSIHMVGTLLDNIVIRDRYDTYSGTSSSNVGKLSDEVFSHVIGNDQGTFFLGEDVGAREIYYLEKGKTKYTKFAEFPPTENFHSFQKMGNHFLLFSNDYSRNYHRKIYLMDPSATDLIQVARVPLLTFVGEQLYPLGSDKMVAFTNSGSIITYNLSKQDSIKIDTSDAVLSNISPRYLPVSGNGKLYYFAFDEKTDEYYLCALSNNGKDVNYVSSAFKLKDSQGSPELAQQPLMLIGKEVYYFSSVNGGSALNVFADNAFELTFNCFHDADSDGVQDPGEIAINALDLEISGFSLGLQSGRSGKIKTTVDAADYTIEPKAPDGWKLTTATKIELKENNTSKNITFNVGVTPKKLQYEIDGIVSNIPIRCSFDVWIRPKLINSGTRAFKGECSVTIDTLIDTDSLKFDEEPDTIIGNQYLWKYDKIDPTHFKAMRIRFRAPGTQFRGRTLRFPIMYRGIGDSNEVIELVDTFKPEINCSYDPNDKAVWPNREGLVNQTLHNEKLTYRIRFQNTGTDTAFNIVVEDTLSKHLDWSTFKLMDYSHKVETKFYDDGLVKFIFKDILLPDSKVNEPESHGFINYTIKAKPGLKEWTEIKNTAYIYFDFNPAIVTNTTLNNMVSEIKYVSIPESRPDNNVLVYPNPASNMLHLVLNDPAPASVKVITSNGKEVLQNQKLQNGQLDVSALQPGIYFISIVQNERVLRASFVKR